MKKINVLKASSSVAASAGLAACGMISFMDASSLNSAMAGNAPTPVPFLVIGNPLPGGNDTPVISPTPSSTPSTALQNAIQNNSLPPQNPVTQSPVSVPDFRIQLQQSIGR